MNALLEAYNQILQEQAYINLTDFKPKYSKEDRQAYQAKLAYKKIKDYINSGSQGDLNLRRTQITSLPDNLKVSGKLDLGETQITSLPDNLKVDGLLNLGGTQITSLPDNFKVGGFLNLGNTPIRSLPDNLVVGGSLILNNTPITSLPDNLSVGGSLSLDNTPISKKYNADELKRMLPGVKGPIYIYI